MPSQYACDVGKSKPPRGTLVVLFALLWALAGCGGAEAPPTPTATPTPTLIAIAADPPAATTLSAPLATTAPAGAPATAAAEPAPTPLPADPADLLAQGRILHRYGDYAAARALFNQVLLDPAAEPAQQAEARFDLGRAYLADELYGEALASLDRLAADLQAAGDPNQFARKEKFLRAEALVGLGRHADAIAAYWQFLEAYPWLGEAVQLRIASAYLSLGDSQSAAAAYARAAEVAGDRFARARLLESQAQAHLAANDPAAAAVAYEAILGFAENAAYRAQVHYQAGQALAAVGDLPAATRRWISATVELPESRSAYLALVELVNRNVDFDLFQRGYIDIQAEAYEPAVYALETYLDSIDPTDARAGQALHLLGQAYAGLGNLVATVDAYDRVLASYPDCACFGQAWLDRAAALAAQGDGAAARQSYRTFAREHKDDPLAAEALWRSGLQALGEGNELEAGVDLLALADAFPESERAPQALYALGMGLLERELYGQAIPLLTRVQEQYPDQRAEAVAYWLGRAYAAAGQPDPARTQWQALVARAPDTYFGVLAAYALARVPMTGGGMMTRIDAVAGPASRLAGDDGSQAFAERWLADWLQAPVEVLATLPLTVTEDQNLAKGALLLELDQRGDALVALERVYERVKDDPRTLYPLSLEFERLGAHRLSLLAAARLLALSTAQLVEEAPLFLQRLAYPRPFADLITDAAQTYGLDPRLYFSLIRQESLFEEGAQSSAAAQGLAQIVPDTGHWIATQLGHPEYTNDLIYRPYINLPFGAYYLDWARGYLGNNIVSALAGYNGGPGNAAAWREASGPDDTRFVEEVSYSETRLYIQLVLSNLYHYARLYREGG